MKREKGGHKPVISRRDFMSAAAAVAAITIVPRHVLGGRGRSSANEKLNIAGIGVGGRGASDLEALEGENFTALCDVDWVQASGTFKRYPNARKYSNSHILERVLIFAYDELISFECKGVHSLKTK